MYRKLLLASLLACSASPALSQNLSHLKVDLLSESPSIQPGGAVTVAFHCRLQKGWHLYWQNPGDSGQAPSITWSLPEGFTPGEIQWPIPQRLPLASLADYGYTNEVVFLVALQAPADLKPGRMVRLAATLHWLVCQEICIPGSKSLNLRLPVRKKQAPYASRNAYVFKMGRKSLPEPMPKDWETSGSLGPKDFHLSFNTGSPLPRTVSASFFPLHGNQVQNAAKQGFEADGTTLRLSLKRSDQLSPGLKTLEGLLVVEEKNAGKKGYWVQVPLADTAR